MQRAHFYFHPRRRCVLRAAFAALAAAVSAGLFSAAPSLLAIDKNGVAPQAISLPAGPGSIQGLGESFQPQLNTGSGATAIRLALPRGPGGIVPDVSLVYNSGAGNGSLGLGWSLSGMLSVRRSTDRGVPYYVDASDGADNDNDGQIDNPEELDTFTGAQGEELVTLPDGSFRAENESTFLRYARIGAGWEARSRDGRRYLFGLAQEARIEESGRVFEWCLERVEDPNGNVVEYEYGADPASPAQKHLTGVRWGGPQAYVAIVLSYETGRADVVTSYRSGFELKTSLRLRGVDVISHGLPASLGASTADFDGDGKSDTLVRRYRFDYKVDAHLSLIERVTQLGSDGQTALPTLTYAYTPWTPPDNVAGTLIRSRDAPAAGFESPSVELIDMNGDGLPDLLTTAGSQHRVVLNLGVGDDGRLRWGPGQPVGNAPTIDISSDKTHLADATADGLSDLMVKVSNTSFLCFDNTSQNAWVNAPFPIRNTDTWPIWPYDGAGGALSRSFDSDYSRTNDILHTGQSGYQLWLLLPGGRYSRELRFAPLVVEGQTFRFDLPGTHIADLNGDRLQDLAWIQASRVVYFPSRGRGSFAPPIILPLGRTLDAAEIERSDFSDVDGDGLVDLTVVRPAAQPQTVIYWLNRFDRGLDGPRTVNGLPPQRTGDALRWADMNGNGTTDIVISQAQSAAGEKIVFVDLVPEGKTHLLRQADNGLGRRISMDYESSTAQMVRARAAGQPWSSVMPIAVTVVGRIREDDGLSPPYDEVISYRDPFYEPTKQEFRGFSQAETRDEGDASAAAKVSRFVYDTGRDEACLKGRQLSEEVLDGDGKLFTSAHTTWRKRVLAEGVDGRQVCYAFSEATDQLVHEGEVEGVPIRSEAEYDDFGNVTVERRLGRADSEGDELVTERAYDLRLDVWRLDLLSRETTRDGAGKRLAEKRSFYDARGNLERLELWLDTEDRFIVALRQKFDAFGNVIEKTDARGSRRSTAYDPLLNAWPVRETVHLGDRDLTLTAEYDLGLGVVTRAVNFALQATEFEHDTLGRLIEKRDAGGAVETYEYQLGAPTSRVIKRGRESASGETLDAHVFYDGQGRELLTKLEAEGGKWRVPAAKAFNSRKLEARVWRAYLSATPDFEVPDPALPNDAKLYDALGRVVETLAPDGSRTRSIYRPLEVQQLDGRDIASGGSPDVRRSDGLDRVVEVEERNGAETYTTRYGWNARGDLESVVDALGNVKRYRFDSLGRLLEIDDPDRGLWRSTFDDVGNLSERTDAREQVVSFHYDAANRVEEKIHEGAGANGSDVVEARWHYDLPAGPLDFGDGSTGTARNTVGRVAWSEDPSGETHFSYDERGNVEWTLKRVRDDATGLLLPYRTQRRHDLLNRDLEVVFPDNDLLRFSYGQGSFVVSIRGDGPQSQSILDSAEYAASGRPLRLEWGNGTESAYEYDANDRLKTERLLAPDGAELRHESYAYDPTSNLTTIDDLRPASVIPIESPRRTTARFEYDELQRLVQAKFGTGSSLGGINYNYDALGNLLSQLTPAPGQPGHIDDSSVALGSISYGGGREDRTGRRPGDPPGPHALTATASGHSLTYDAGGNVTGYDGAQLSWDFEGRLAEFSDPDSVAAYVYDASGERAIRRVQRSAGREEVWQIDAACEVRHEGAASTVVKYAFLNGRRVARIQGSLDPERETVQSQRLAAGWTLLSSALETSAKLRDVCGADASVFVANGATSYTPLDLAAPLPFGKALWVHVPTARRVTWKGRARSLPASTTSVGPLHAWPRLEAFRPAVDLEGAPSFLVFDAVTRRWLRRDSSLPAFLSDAPAELGTAQCFWTQDEVRFQPVDAHAVSLEFYHTDSVGSTAAITDANGDLVEERAHYPYGAVRNLHRPGVPRSGTDHDFTGHERDPESGLVHMGERTYLDLAGVFLSPDPRYAAVAALGHGSDDDQTALASYLLNPQMANLYAYALRQPLKYIDPDGLDPQVAQGHGLVVTDSVRSYGSYKTGVSAFITTKAGQDLVTNIRIHRGTVILREGPVRGGDTSHLDFDPGSRTAVVTIDWNKHVDRARNDRWLVNRIDSEGTITHSIARDINWELRKVELSIRVNSLGEDLQDLQVLGESTQQRRLQNSLDQSHLVNPATDPQHSSFERDMAAQPKTWARQRAEAAAR